MGHRSEAVYKATHTHSSSNGLEAERELVYPVRGDEMPS